MKTQGVMTESEAARFARTVEGFSNGVDVDLSAEFAIKLKRDGFAFGRAKRKPVVVSFPEVDRRRTERRIFERRSMEDALNERAAVCDRRKLTGERVSIMGGL